MSGTNRPLAIGICCAVVVVTAGFCSVNAVLAVTTLDDVKAEIKETNSDVSKKKTDLQEINSRIKRYQQVVMEKKAEAASLSDEVALIDNRIAKEELSIDIAREEILSLESEIDLLDKRVIEKEKKMTERRKALAGLVRKLNRIENRNSLFELLLAKGSFSEFFSGLHAVSKLQVAVRETLEDVRVASAELQEEKGNRERKREATLQKKRELEAARLELEDQRAFKQDILLETKSSELEYRYLLADLKEEQNQADSEIQYLEKVLREKKDLAARLATENAVLSWPVEPTRGITAIFHDPDYPFRKVFEHPGIDVRAYQSTPIRAAAAGVVARAKNAGMGYSYIMLMHSSNLATVYGHVSKIVAKEDTFVERGEIIGYSGGMPGTPGAGSLTTGPHLHFETRLKGIPVDPMKYLVKYDF